MRTYLLKTVVASLCMLSFTVCTHVFAGSNDTTTIRANAGYIKPSDLPVGDKSVNQIRYKALRDSATTLGANGALAWRSAQINQSLEKEKTHLNSVFDFNQLIINHNVLPPVYAESNNNIKLDNDNTIRFNDKTYVKISPERFVTTPPTWRDYLYMNYDKPTLPDNSLLPTTQAEANIWNRYIAIGWQQGLQQANNIFETNLDTMKRDFLGMVLYKKLLAQNIVSAPYVAKADLGVTGNKNELHINDQVMRITGHSELQTNSNNWTPVFTH